MFTWSEEEMKEHNVASEVEIKIGAKKILFCYRAAFLESYELLIECELIYS